VSHPESGVLVMAIVMELDVMTGGWFGEWLGSQAEEPIK